MILLPIQTVLAVSARKYAALLARTLIMRHISYVDVKDV